MALIESELRGKRRLLRWRPWILLGVQPIFWGFIGGRDRSGGAEVPARDTLGVDCVVLVRASTAIQVARRGFGRGFGVAGLTLRRGTEIPAVGGDGKRLPESSGKRRVGSDPPFGCEPLLKHNAFHMLGIG
jgi:hypothetical protein